MKSQIVNQILKTLNKEEAVEYAKCYKSILYFVDKYIYFNDKERGFVKLETFPYQRDLLVQLKDAFIKKDKKRMKYIINKSRQLGISWVVAIFMLWVFIYGKDQRMLIGSKKEGDAQEILKRIRDMYNFLPDFFYFNVGDDNKSRWENLDRRNIISCEPTVEGFGRSLTPNFVFMDEMAHMPEGVDDRELWKSLLPAIENGMFIGVSTPAGFGNLFHHFWMNHREAGFICIPIHWSARPDRCRNKKLFKELETRRKQGLLPTPDQIELLKEEQWYKDIRKQMDEDGWMQEYELSFLSSGRPVFNQEHIQIQEDKYVFNPITVDSTGLLVWEEPVENIEYIACLDPSQGIGKDNHCLHVFKINDRNIEQVLEYANSNPTPDFIRKAVELVIKYNQAFFIFENNIQSDVIMSVLEEFNYYNIYYSPKTGRPGRETTKTSKNLMVKDMADALKHEDIKIRSKYLIDELRTFVHTESGEMKGYSGCKDDRVMSCMLVFDALNSRVGVL